MPATQKQIKILQHTLGLSTEHRAPCRNHYVAGAGHHAMADLEALEQLGLVGRARTPSFCPPGDLVFFATDAGRAMAIEHLPDPPNRTQYQEWIDADCGQSFGEFLCGSRLPEIETRGEFWRGTQEYRMYRTLQGEYEHRRDVQGAWCKTKKEAKASYKVTLLANKTSNP